MNTWVKSSHSHPDGTNCVEWAPASATSGTVPIRDSKRPTGPLLHIPANAFAGLVSAIKGGAFSV